MSYLNSKIDQTLLLDPSFTPFSSSNPLPTSNTVSSGLVWNNESTGVAGNSSSYQPNGRSSLSVFGNLSGATTIKLQASNDDNTWYDTGSSITTSGSGDVAGHFTFCAPYLRFQSSADVTASLILQSSL